MSAIDVRKQVIKAIKRFDFDDYGLHDVDPKSQYAEWVPDLADAIVKALGPRPTIRLKRPNDEALEVWVGRKLVASANHDEHGWSGVDAVESTAVAIARALGGEVADRG